MESRPRASLMRCGCRATDWTKWVATGSATDASKATAATADPLQLLATAAAGALASGTELAQLQKHKTAAGPRRGSAGHGGPQPDRGGAEGQGDAATARRQMLDSCQQLRAARWLFQLQLRHLLQRLHQDPRPLLFYPGAPVHLRYVDLLSQVGDRQILFLLATGGEARSHGRLVLSCTCLHVCACLHVAVCVCVCACVCVCVLFLAGGRLCRRPEGACLRFCTSFVGRWRWPPPLYP